jgi:hypothetical protein
MDNRQSGSARQCAAQVLNNKTSTSIIGLAAMKMPVLPWVHEPDFTPVLLSNV